MVLEKTIESPLDCKKIKSVNSKENQPWIFIGRTFAEVEAPSTEALQFKCQSTSAILRLWITQWKDYCWSWCEEPTHWKRLWCWERVKGWQRIRWLNSIPNSMHMKLQEIVKAREAWRPWYCKESNDLATEQQNLPYIPMLGVHIVTTVTLSSWIDPLIIM